MRRILAAIICASLLVSGCATTGAPRVQAPATPVDPALLASYVKQLPIGARVRVDFTNGRTMKGTLMKTTDTSIVIQRRTRIPEPPDDLSLATIAAVQIETNTGGPARAAWIGAAAGAGGALAVFLVLAAIFSGN